MMAVNDLMPNMPRLEMVNVPPWNSVGLSLFSRARSARSLVALAIPARPASTQRQQNQAESSNYRPSLSAPKTIGVIRPVSVDTATLMSAELYWRMYVSIHDELTAGTLRRESAAALTTKSLTDSLNSPLPGILENIAPRNTATY